MRVVLDANIFVSSALFGGVPADVVSLCRDGVVRVGVSSHILEELSDVFKRKFKWEDNDVWLFEEEVFSFAEYVECDIKVRMPKLSAGDRKVLETAVSFGADFIVSGDSDLLDLGVFREIPIVAPRDFLGQLA